MSLRDRIALFVLLLPTIGLLGQGILYVSTTQFMQYHADALAVEWDALPANYRGFVLGVIKGMGAGSVAVSMAILIILGIPFRRGENWARWAAPLIGIVFTGLTAYAAFTIDRLTPAETPWRQTLLLTGAYVAGGAICLLRSSQRRSARP
jgi:hypothetical protein